MRNVFTVTAVLIFSVLAFSACSAQPTSSTPLTRGTIPTMQNSPQPVYEAPTLEETPIPATQATLVTNKGEITFKLFRNEVPLTTQNFVKLASKGFYDGIVVHRVIAGFMSQVGDPLTKDESKKALWGTGGPGYRIKDEFSPKLRHNKPGIVSMANSGPNTGGSQFFITHEATEWLDDVHAVFGEVTSGMDVVTSIEQGDKIISVKLQ